VSAKSADVPRSCSLKLGEARAVVQGPPKKHTRGQLSGWEGVRSWDERETRRRVEGRRSGAKPQWVVFSEQAGAGPVNGERGRGKKKLEDTENKSEELRDDRVAGIECERSGPGPDQKNLNLV